MLSTEGTKPASPPLSCDGCTMCCKLLAIDELDKPEQQWCPHCDIGRGCGRYATRPHSCQVFACQWLKSQATGKPMAPQLRPDRSHVVIGATTDSTGVVLHVDPRRPDAHLAPLLQNLQHNALRSGLRVFVLCGERRVEMTRVAPPARRGAVPKMAG